ncbi:MAG: hypothetical protein WC846_00590 [Candidatus Gracilibacteria bacterium]|jgi:hypothetical protein
MAAEKPRRYTDEKTGKSNEYAGKVAKKKIDCGVILAEINAENLPNPEELDLEEYTVTPKDGGGLLKILQGKLFQKLDPKVAQKILLQSYANLYKETNAKGNGDINALQIGDTITITAGKLTITRANKKFKNIVAVPIFPEQECEGKGTPLTATEEPTESEQTKIEKIFTSTTQDYPPLANYKLSFPNDKAYPFKIENPTTRKSAEIDFIQRKYYYTNFTTENGNSVAAASENINTAMNFGLNAIYLTKLFDDIKAQTNNLEANGDAPFRVENDKTIIFSKRGNRLENLNLKFDYAPPLPSQDHYPFRIDETVTKTLNRLWTEWHTPLETPAQNTPLAAPTVAPTAETPTPTHENQAKIDNAIKEVTQYANTKTGENAKVEITTSDNTHFNVKITSWDGSSEELAAIDISTIDEENFKIGLQQAVEAANKALFIIRKVDSLKKRWIESGYEGTDKFYIDKDEHQIKFHGWGPDETIIYRPIYEEFSAAQVQLRDLLNKAFNKVVPIANVPAPVQTSSPTSTPKQGNENQQNPLEAERDRTVTETLNRLWTEWRTPPETPAPEATTTPSAPAFTPPTPAEKANDGE